MLTYVALGFAVDLIVPGLPSGTEHRLAYYFATHPYPQDRIAALPVQIQENRYIFGETIALNQLIEQVPEATEEVSF